MGDCFPAERRGHSLSLFSIVPLLGPAVGPIAGGFITKCASWRWSFHTVSIIDAVILLAGLRFLRETWAPKLLERRRCEMILKTGNKELYIDLGGMERSWRSALKVAMSRPFKLLATEPIMQVGYAPFSSKIQTHINADVLPGSCDISRVSLWGIFHATFDV